MSISKSSLLERVRLKTEMQSELMGKLINCPMCVSFWVGMAITPVYSPTGFFLSDAFMAVGAVWVLYSFVWGLAVHDESF